MASRIVSIFVFALFLLSVVSVREANSFSSKCFVFSLKLSLFVVFSKLYRTL